MDATFRFRVHLHGLVGPFAFDTAFLNVRKLWSGSQDQRES